LFVLINIDTFLLPVVQQTISVGIEMRCAHDHAPLVGRNAECQAMISCLLAQPVGPGAVSQRPRYGILKIKAIDVCHQGEV
jgi:hypothetical protein